VLITRPLEHSDSLASLLAAEGGEPVAFPTIAIVPDVTQIARLEAALSHLLDYDWIIFTSQSAVALFWDCAVKAAVRQASLAQVKIAAIGPATRDAIHVLGIQVDVMPEEHRGEAIALAMGDVRGQRVLLPRAQAAREALVNDLSAKGARVDEIPLYRTETVHPDPAAWEALDRGVDYVTFTSASTVHSFFDLLGDRAAPLLAQVVTACIGPVTAEALAEHGVTPQVVASPYTAQGVVKAMIDYENQFSS
jgi:uroporphyrinogen III methyltransferase/synthase